METIYKMVESVINENKDDVRNIINSKKEIDKLFLDYKEKVEFNLQKKKESEGDVLFRVAHLEYLLLTGQATDEEKEELTEILDTANSCILELETVSIKNRYLSLVKKLKYEMNKYGELNEMPIKVLEVDGTRTVKLARVFFINTDEGYAPFIHHLCRVMKIDLSVVYRIDKNGQPRYNYRVNTANGATAIGQFVSKFVEEYKNENSR